MTETISELQQTRDALKQNLQDMDENIKKLTGRDPDQELRLSTPRRVQLKRNSYGTPGDNQTPTKRTPTERRRWGKSALTAQNNLDSGGEEEEKKKPVVHSSVVVTGKPIESLRPAREDVQTRKRNQRMFGLLLGTLKQFKQESKFKSEQESKREEKLQKVEEKVEKDKEDAIRERKELYQSRRDKQKELKKIEFKLEMAELVVDLKSHYKEMKDFIQLKSTPRLFYKPYQHNKKTTKLLEDSRNSLQESLEQRLKEIEMCTEEDLFQLSRTQRIHRQHGKTAKDPIVIDAAPSTRDLFAEDAEIENREREADEMKEQAKSEQAETNQIDKSVDDVVMNEQKVANEVFGEIAQVDSNDVITIDMRERVVANNEDSKIEVSDKTVNEPINVQDNQDSRRVVSNTNYSVVDERVVELSANTTLAEEEKVDDDMDLDAEVHEQLENLQGGVV